MIGRIVRIVISLGISIVPLLYLAGYLSFIPGLPSPASLLGAYGLTGGLSYFSIPSGGAGTAVPFGAMGLSGIIAFSLLSRVGGTVSSVAMSAGREMPKIPNLTSMPGFNNMMGKAFTSIPEALPADLSKSQFLILKLVRDGTSKTGDISKALSMDKKEVQRGMNALATSGYLAKGNKLTAKGLDLLGS